MEIIIKKELMQYLGGIQFYILLVISVLMASLSTNMNYVKYRSELSNYIELSQSYQEDIQKYGKELWSFQPKSFIKPSFVSIFAFSVEKTFPISIAPTQDDLKPEFSELSTDSFEMAFGSIDLLFVIQVFFSLIGLLFAANSVTSEKETGTLKLTLTNPIARSFIIFAKFIAGGIVVLFLLLCVYVSIILTLSILTAQVWNTAVILRLFCSGLLSYIYSMLFFGLGLFISTLVSNSRSAIIISLFVWLVAVIFLPRTSFLLARISFPVQSSQNYQNNIRLVRNNLENERDDLIAKEYLQYWSQLQNVAGPIMKIGVRQLPIRENNDKDIDTLKTIVEKIKPEFDYKINATVNKIKEGQRNGEEEQTNFAMIISRISPAASLTYSFTSLFNVSFQDKRQLTHAINRYQQTLNSLYFSKFIIVLGEVFNLPKISLSSLPSLQYIPLGLNESIDSYIIDIGLLLFWSVLFFTLSYIRFNNYDVR